MFSLPCYLANRIYQRAALCSSVKGSRWLGESTFLPTSLSDPDCRPTGCSLLPRSVNMLQQGAAAAQAASVVDESDFVAMQQEMQREDDAREAIVKHSRDLQKLAKQAIFSLHRCDLAEANGRLSRAGDIVQALLKRAEGSESKYGSLSSALEEYAEAVLFRGFLVEGRLLTRKELAVADRDQYLGGVLDFTGELSRYAVARATVRDVAQVRHCRDLVDLLLGLFLQFDLRNGSLRRKFDGLKYTLRKLENILYELSLAENGVKRQDKEDVDCDQQPDAGPDIAAQEIG